MTTNPSHPAAAANKKLHTRIAAAQKLADAAKKEAKLAKVDFRNAKQIYKDARRAARNLRKEVKALKTELARLAVKKTRLKPKVAKPAAPKTAAKRVRLIVAPATSTTQFETSPLPVENVAIPVVIPPSEPTA